MSEKNLEKKKKEKEVLLEQYSSYKQIINIVR